jgi:hypothetical protein
MCYDVIFKNEGRRHQKTEIAYRFSLDDDNSIERCGLFALLLFFVAVDTRGVDLLAYPLYYWWMIVVGKLDCFVLGQAGHSNHSDQYNNKEARGLT